MCAALHETQHAQHGLARIGVTPGVRTSADNPAVKRPTVAVVFDGLAYCLAICVVRYTTQAVSAKPPLQQPGPRHEAPPGAPGGGAGADPDQLPASSVAAAAATHPALAAAARALPELSHVHLRLTLQRDISSQAETQGAMTILRCWLKHCLLASNQSRKLSLVPPDISRHHHGVDQVMCPASSVAVWWIAGDEHSSMLGGSRGQASPSASPQAYEVRSERHAQQWAALGAPSC